MLFNITASVHVNKKVKGFKNCSCMHGAERYWFQYSVFTPLVSFIFHHYGTGILYCNDRRTHVDIRMQMQTLPLRYVNM